MHACGGCGEEKRPLSETSEQRLLEHLAGARAAVAEGELVKARGALGTFAGEVSRLEQTGALSSEQASALLTGARRARATLAARIDERQRDAAGGAPPSPGLPPSDVDGEREQREQEEAEEEEREEREEEEREDEDGDLEDED